MKIYQLSFLIMIATACSSQPKEFDPAHSSSIPEITTTTPAPATPSISSGPSSSVQLRTAEISIQDSKSQTIGAIHLQETKNAILVLFETKKLAPGTYQIRLEENCQGKMNRRALASSDNLIKEIKIQGNSYSDEFKLNGYSFETGNTQGLKNKAFKFYQIGKKSEFTQAACGQIQI